jgi:hypothetical protein
MTMKMLKWIIEYKMFEIIGNDGKMFKINQKKIITMFILIKNVRKVVKFTKKFYKNVHNH